MDDWSVYALWSESYDKLYIGMSSNVTQRVEQHNLRKQKSTKAFVPWKLIYSEPCTSRQHAREREKYWKTGEGRRRLRLKVKRLKEESDIS